MNDMLYLCPCHALGCILYTHNALGMKHFKCSSIFFANRQAAPYKRITTRATHATTHKGCDMTGSLCVFVCLREVNRHMLMENIAFDTFNSLFACSCKHTVWWMIMDSSAVLVQATQINCCLVCLTWLSGAIHTQQHKCDQCFALHSPVGPKSSLAYLVFMISSK